MTLCLWLVIQNLVFRAGFCQNLFFLWVDQTFLFHWRIFVIFLVETDIWSITILKICFSHSSRINWVLELCFEIFPNFFCFLVFFFLLFVCLFCFVLFYFWESGYSLCVVTNIYLLLLLQSTSNQTKIFLNAWLQGKKKRELVSLKLFILSSAAATAA